MRDAAEVIDKAKEKTNEYLDTDINNIIIRNIHV